MGTNDIGSKATSLDEKIRVGKFEISRIEPELATLKARVHELANKLKLKDVELAIKEEDLSIKLKDPHATEEELQSLADEIALKTQEFDATLEESTQVGIMLEATKLELRQLVARVKHSEALKNSEEGKN